MEIKKIYAVYFSPNGKTKEIVVKLSKSIGDYEIQEIDITTLKSRDREIKLKQDELLVIGFPVYADRLPIISEGVFENLLGNNNPVIAVVSYGNRSYGDALLELSDKLEKKNMKILSASAIIGEHCLNKNVGTDRPDAEDHLKLSEYGKSLNEKLRGIKDINSIGKIHIKGNYPYKALKESRTPVGDYSCIQCGLCQEGCPVQAIDKNDYRNTDSDLCIYCGRCINICPTGARVIKEESYLEYMKEFEVITRERREMEIYI